jgi:ATP-dependent exoDNAse (exonuclease V) beta subunit
MIAPNPNGHDEALADGDKLLALDSHNRLSALNTNESYIVKAPAGAGKTELLTQRVLALLATVDEPEEIVALTFTNKAAAEMRDRVVSSLRRSASGQPPVEAHKITTYELGRKVLERDAARQWHLLEHAGRLQITTIDALCGQLARQMPLMARMGSQPGVATDAQAHYAQAAQATLQSLDEGHEAADAIARVLDHLDNNAGSFQALVCDMLASRDQWLRHVHDEPDLDAAEKALGWLIRADLDAALAALPAAAQTRFMPAARWAASQAMSARAAGDALNELEPLVHLVDWSTPLTQEVDDLPKWRGLAALLLNKDGGPRKVLPSDFGLGTPQGKPLGKALKEAIAQELDDGAAAALARLRQLPSPTYGASEQQLITDMLTVLKVAYAHLWLTFKTAGEVDFTEMAHNALMALGSDEAPSDLQLSLDYRIQHLLVDEFQDTSPTQVELLTRLIRGWQPGDGRTLFLVGDPMQSIYRFRKADVGLFLKVKAGGLGHLALKELVLFRNNRSHVEVVDWGNRVFPNVFASEDNFHRGAVRFDQAQATKGTHPRAGVTWHPIIDAGGDEAEADDEEVGPADEREAQAVIDIVRQAQTEDPAGTVAILVRARSHLGALVKALQAHRPALAYQAVEIDTLAHKQVIQDLLSLTQALLHQGDRVHWLAVLRAPWCGLLLQDLHRLAGDDHRATVWSLMNDPARTQSLSPDGRSRLGHVREVIEEAYAHQGRQRLRRWVEGVWQQLGGPQCLQGPADLLDSQAFFKVLDELDDHGSLDLGQLEAEVGKLFSQPDPSATARLQIMTVHKSKGLEFDTVILPGLHKKASPNDKKLILWDEVAGEQGRLQRIVAHLPNGAQQASGEPTKYGLLRRFESDRNRNETQRLLYVAVTRAKRHLHLLGRAKISANPDNGILNAPASDSLLSLLWPVARTEFEAALVQPSTGSEADVSSCDKAPAIVPESFDHRLVRLRLAQRPEPLRSASIGTSAEPTPALERLPLEGDQPQAAGRLTADIGTLVHKYLEIIGRDGLEGWHRDRLLGLKPAMRRWLRQQGHAGEELGSATDEVWRHLATTLQSEMGRWILGPRDAAQCEVPYTTARDGEIQTHVIDRTFVEDGVRWIVDYKTTRPSDDEEPRAEHQAQLSRYRSLFGADTDVRTVVFYTRTGGIQDV